MQNTNYTITSYKHAPCSLLKFLSFKSLSQSTMHACHSQESIACSYMFRPIRVFFPYARNRLSSRDSHLAKGIKKNKEGERRIKGIAMAQWVNRLRNNIFVNPPPFALRSGYRSGNRTHFSMFTHVRITFIAFSVLLHRFVVLSIQFAIVYWYFMFSFSRGSHFHKTCGTIRDRNQN